MDSTRTKSVTCHCQVCGENYEWVRLAGRHVEAKKICPKCFEWHRWCPSCKRGKLISEFDVNSKGHNGVQHRCKPCLMEQRGNIKIRHCQGCETDCVATNSTSYNGRSIWICWTCSQTVKHCKSCDQLKELSNFPVSNDKATGRSAWCRTCFSKKWAMQDHSVRSSRRLKKFDLTWDEYQSMLASQDYRCAICGLHETDTHREGVTRALAVDHCHTSGRVRQLLCGRCNKALGLMQDDPQRLRNAAQYIDRHST